MIKAKEEKNVNAARAFLTVMPRRFLNAQTYQLALSVCVHAKDVQSGRNMFEALPEQGVVPDRYACPTECVHLQQPQLALCSLACMYSAPAHCT
jgi:pentatricopeptide repeat protein